MNAIISRRRVHVDRGIYSGKPVIAASVVRTDAGYDAVLIVQDLGPVTEAGHETAEAAEKRIFEMLDNDVPDFLGGNGKVKKSRSRAKATVTETRTSGRTPRHHGRVDYVITGETEGQIMHQVRKLNGWYQGYGMSFGELETIDGVLSLRGYRSDNCD